MSIIVNFDFFVWGLNLNPTHKFPVVRSDILDSTRMEYASFRIRIHLIRIQGFADQKLKEKKC